MSTAPPTVSVIVLTVNRSHLISRSIESVRKQSLENWELIVVHDGPDQKTEDVIREWERRDSRIRYFRRGKLGNIAEATNFGLKQARARYVAILDDDDYWTEADKLERQVAFLESQPEYVACGGGLIVVDPNGNERLRYLKPETDGEIRALCLVANPMAHSVMLYRLAAALEVGGYDESLPGFQDWDLWLKLGRKGKLHNFPAYLGTYLIWEGGGSYKQRRANTASGVRIVWRHRSHYKGFLKGFTLAVAYYVYSHLPDVVVKHTFPALSRWKKRVFTST